MQEELSCLIDNQTRILFDLPPRRKAVRCNGYTRLRSTNTELSKSRMMRKGQSQKPGIDNNDTLEPSQDKMILKCVLTLALHIGYTVQTVIFDDGSGRVCLLQKCIYGLKPSQKKWYFRLWILLKSVRFKSCPKKPCLLAKKLFIYGDDILKNKACLPEISRSVEVEIKIKYLGKPKHILGVHMEFVSYGISLSQRQNIAEIVLTLSFLNAVDS